MSNYCALCPINKKPSQATRKIFGVWACEECLKRVNNINIKSLSATTNASEHEPDSIKDQRAEYFKSILQPSRDGVASKEFIEAYPKQASGIFKPEQIKKAKYVWKDLKGWNTRDRSK